MMDTHWMDVELDEVGKRAVQEAREVREWLERQEEQAAREAEAKQVREIMEGVEALRRDYERELTELLARLDAGELERFLVAGRQVMEAIQRCNALLGKARALEEGRRDGQDSG